MPWMENLVFTDCLGRHRRGREYQKAVVECTGFGEYFIEKRADSWKNISHRPVQKENGYYERETEMVGPAALRHVVRGADAADGIGRGTSGDLDTGRKHPDGRRPPGGLR